MKTFQYREPRFTGSFEVRIANDGSGVSWRAVATDVSINGIGLDCDGDLTVGDRVTLSLSSGRQPKTIVVKGRVVSRNGRHVGLALQFSKPSRADEFLKTCSALGEGTAGLSLV